jgi:hypothetical protein
MTYEITARGSELCVYVTSIDPPQYLTLAELSAWMRETRDGNPDLYAELVPAYIALSKATPPDENDNPSIVNLPAISRKWRK